MVDPLWGWLQELLRDLHLLAVAVTGLSAALDEVLDPLGVLGSEHHPEELAIDSSAAFPLVRHEVEEAGDANGVPPDAPNGELGEDGHLDVLALKLGEASLPPGDDLL